MVEAYVPPLGELVQLMLEQRQPQYELFEHGNRHGSYVWTFAQSAGEMLRFIEVAQTPAWKLRGDGRTRIEIDVRYGADDGANYKLERVALTRTSIAELSARSGKKFAALQGSVEVAHQRAEQLEIGDLDQHRRAPLPQELVRLGQDMGRPPEPTG